MITPKSKALAASLLMSLAVAAPADARSSWSSVPSASVIERELHPYRRDFVPGRKAKPRSKHREGVRRIQFVVTYTPYKRG